MLSHRSLSSVLFACLSLLGTAACSGGSSTTPESSPATSPTTAPTTVPAPAPTPPTSAPVACVATVTTTLPGVTVRVKNERCDFSLSQAAAGIKIDWELVVDADLPTLYIEGLVSGATQTELQLFSKLSGNGQHYCLCDTGPQAATVATVDIPAGVYPGALQWDGKNWSGPSDVPSPKGAAFPEGDYVLELHAEGAHVKPAAGTPFAKDYDVDVKIPIKLLK